MEKDPVYCDIHRFIWKRVGFSKMFTKKSLYRIFGETFHITKIKRPLALMRMIQFGMIEEIDEQYSHCIKVNPPQMTEEEENHYFYQAFKLF